MDVLAHTLWTNALFHLKYHNQRRLRYLAAFFGVLPDFLSFVPAFIFLLFSGFRLRPETLLDTSANWTLNFAEISYNFTHSIVIFAGIFLLVTLVGNWYVYAKSPSTYKFWFFWPMLGWLLHILIDIPSHRDIYETPFLFPISDYKFGHGVSWAHPVFMAINYSSLIVVYLLLTIYQRRKYLNDKIFKKGS